MIFKAKWEKEEVYGLSPPPRTSHTSTAYKQNYFIIIGGEGFNSSKYYFFLFFIKFIIFRWGKSPAK